MEVYFKNLTAEETPTERLVADVMMLVNETEGLVDMTGAGLDSDKRVEIKTALQQIKERCHQLKQHAVAGAQGTDRFIRRYPYPILGLAFGLGVFVGVLAGRRSRD